MKKILLCLLLLLLDYTIVYADSSSVSVTTTPTIVATFSSTRKVLFVRLDPSATDFVLCGDSSGDVDFKLSAGDTIVLEVKAIQEVWCDANSGTQTTYVWERF